MIFPGTGGALDAIPFERGALENAQELVAETVTVDPPGMAAGNAIEHEVPLGVTTAPATEVLHVYAVAPGTAAML